MDIPPFFLLTECLFSYIAEFLINFLFVPCYTYVHINIIVLTDLNNVYIVVTRTGWRVGKKSNK